jgi:hypothetical protein
MVSIHQPLRDALTSLATRQRSRYGWPLAAAG